MLHKRPETRGRKKSRIRDQIKELLKLGYGDDFIRGYLYIQSMKEQEILPYNALRDPDFLYPNMNPKEWAGMRKEIEKHFMRSKKLINNQIGKALWDAKHEKKKE